MKTFRRLQEQYNLTIIIVTHDPRILGFADRIARIEDGRVLSDDEGADQHDT